MSNKTFMDWGPGELFELLCIIGAAVFLVVAILITNAMSGQTAPAATKINGLELGEGKRRAVSLQLATNRVTSDQKRLARAQTNVTAAPAAQTAAIAKAQAAATAAKTPADKATAAKQLAAAQKITANAQAKLDAENKHLTADKKTVGNEQLRVSDWNSKTLASHHAKGKSIDWTKGTIQ